MNDVDWATKQELKCTFLKRLDTYVEKCLFVKRLKLFPFVAENSHHPMEDVDETLIHHCEEEHNKSWAHVLNHVEVFVAIIFEPDSIRRLDWWLSWSHWSLVKRFIAFSVFLEWKNAVIAWYLGSFKEVKAYQLLELFEDNIHIGWEVDVHQGDHHQKLTDIDHPPKCGHRCRSI